jgi:hypothetical protein
MRSYKIGLWLIVVTLVFIVLAWYFHWPFIWVSVPGGLSVTFFLYHMFTESRKEIDYQSVVQAHQDMKDSDASHNDNYKPKEVHAFCLTVITYTAKWGSKDEPRMSLYRQLQEQLSRNRHSR